MSFWENNVPGVLIVHLFVSFQPRQFLNWGYNIKRESMYKHKWSQVFMDGEADRKKHAFRLLRLGKKGKQQGERGYQEVHCKTERKRTPLETDSHEEPVKDEYREVRC